MAGRPRKTRLDYFPFAVDMFEDEKIVCISVEHGIAGEMAAVKLLCAIYRNGYYIKWTEAMRLKILRQLPGVDGDTLDAVISALIHWGFFDSELYEKENVLTSRGIQRRYFEISKRWLGQDEYDYLLIDIDGIFPKKVARKKGTPAKELPGDKKTESISPAETVAPIATPTQEEVTEYFKAHSECPDDWQTQASLFFNHYAANGWCNNQGVRIVQWQPKANYWILKNKQQHSLSSNYETNQADKFSRRRGVEPQAKSHKEFNGSFDI